MNLSDTNLARLAAVVMPALSILTVALIVSPAGLGAKAPLNPTSLNDQMPYAQPK